MPTNANTFNSRVTSEALEAKFRQVFPAQGGAELVQDLYASGVVQPVIDFSSVAEGSVLASNLQTAWDFSTGKTRTANSTDTMITNTGFWRVSTQVVQLVQASPLQASQMWIDDGSTQKIILEIAEFGSTPDQFINAYWEGIVFLRAGDSLKQATTASSITMATVYRQIADVNGNLVNPLGFTFS